MHSWQVSSPDEEMPLATSARTTTDEVRIAWGRNFEWKVPLSWLLATPVASAETIRRLVAKLDHDKFARREEAGRELARLGPQAGPALRRALADAKTSRDARSRIEALLKALDQWLVTDRETLRGLRAVWVLERIGSPEARAILKRLAGGAPEARLTKAAKSALGRLKSR